MLGSAILDVLGDRFHCIGVSGRVRPADSKASHWITTNINDTADLKASVFRAEPDVIVHAASSVAVNDCEKPQFRDAIFHLHVGVTEALASVARELRAQFIYVSTESVYDGKKPGLYVEDDAPNPLNHYATTKLQGEETAMKYDAAMVLRTNIFGWRTDGLLSFGEWVLEGLRKGERRTMFTDVTFTPLSTYCLAESIGHSINKRLSGLYHAGGADFVSKYEFALRLARRLNLPSQTLIACSLDDVVMGAPRPKNTGMDSSKLAKALGYQRPTLEQSMDAWLSRGASDKAPACSAPSS